MTSAEIWQKGNDAYLAAVVAWLHLRLKRLAQRPAETATHVERSAQEASTPGPSAVAPPATAKKSWLSGMFQGHGSQISAETPQREDSTSARPDFGQSTEEIPNAPSDDPLTQAAATMQAAAQALDPPPPALMLQRLLGLSNFELEILLLCMAMELDTQTADLCAHAQGKARSYPTFALTMALFDDPAWEALSPERPLRYWRLIEILQPEGQPLMTSPLRADERIVSYVKGLNYLDDRLAPFLSPLPVPTSDAGLASSQQGQVEQIAARLKAAREADAGRLPVVQLIGPETSAKDLVAAAAAGSLGLALYRLPAAMLPIKPTELDNWVRLWQRETALLPVGLVLDAGERDEQATVEGAIRPVTQFLVHLNALVFLICREPWSRLKGDTLIFEIEKPTPVEQAETWSRALGVDSGETSSRLAGQFDLDLTEIRTITARQHALNRTGLLDLWQACLSYSRPGLDLLAQRIVPRATWRDIVLPEATARLLEEIADQVEHRNQVYDTWGFRGKLSRGLGISVLFDGESGTGKTMAAEVIASQLQLNLYRIDLSAVVSKYIGQTEKNLRRLFDAAEGGGGILFFDEADSIFGKRSEVKDSHDRYANIEINYLLQRMEAYQGLAILATNMKGALDQAFVRRLRFIVKFPVPGQAERKSIWMKIFPPETPLELTDPDERVDYDRLAKVNLTGGGINNAALNAAFLAARAGSKVTMSLLVRAIQTELKKMERSAQQV
jgi:hypothetical protein